MAKQKTDLKIDGAGFNIKVCAGMTEDAFVSAHKGEFYKDLSDADRVTKLKDAYVQILAAANANAQAPAASAAAPAPAGDAKPAPAK